MSSMAEGEALSKAIQGLAEAFGDRIDLRADERSKFETDFGKVVFQTPGAIARCTNAAEVAEVIRYCRKFKVPIVARGQGHTQTGQSTTNGGVVVDTSAMQTIHSINEDELYADCDGGVVWHDLVVKVVPMGFVPPVLTNNLGVSIAGTTSVAGLGVASYKYGTQADSAIELEVVTGAGDIVTCSREENADLFNSVRSGLSQFGIITRVKTKLRRCRRSACTTCSTTTSVCS